MNAEFFYILVALHNPLPTIEWHQVHAYATQAECTTARRAMKATEDYTYSCFPLSEYMKHAGDKSEAFYKQHPERLRPKVPSN